MTKEERFTIILSKVQNHHKVEYSTLSKELSVSEDTVRRDIKELVNDGLISKTKGGAVRRALVPVTYQEREVFSSSSKQIIAHKAAVLFRNGQIVAFDGGTTPFLIASYLPREIEITIVTHSYPIANLAFEYPNIDLIFIGGRASKKSKISTGLDVINKYKSVHVDMSIIGVHSLHPEIGFTDPIMEEAEIKNIMTTIADKVVVVPTADKLNAVTTFTVSSIDAIDTIITDLEPTNILLEPFKKLLIEVL